MRLGYFGYYVTSTEEVESSLVDLRKFIRDFVESDDVAFKASMSFGGETLLLLPLDQNTYLFVQTREQELIKSVQRNEWSVDDIKNALDRDQSIGFASYVYVGKHWFAIACRILSPRQSAFAHLICKIFEKLNIPYRLVLRAFQSSVNEAEVEQLDRVGLIRIEINKYSPLMPTILDLISGGDGTEFMDATSLEIRLKPSRKKTSDLKGGLQAMLENLPKNGLAAFQARARFEAIDRMSDMHIYGSGAISDYLEIDDEDLAAISILKLAKANKKLKASLKDFRDDQLFETDSSASQLGISWASTHGANISGSEDA
jgi:RexA-like intracellular sensor of abortive infection system